MKQLIVSLTTLILVLVCVTRQAKADLIVNGGFETGDFTGWTLSGDTGFASVQTSGYDGGAYNPHSGTYFAALGLASQSLGYLSQTFTDPNPGETLSISLYLASNGELSNEFEVVFNGVTLVDDKPFPATGSSGPYPYVQLSFDVTSSSSNTLQIGFSDYFTPSFALDDVSVTPTASGVSEPSTLLLLGQGAAALLGLTWRSRRKFRTAAA